MLMFKGQKIAALTFLAALFLCAHSSYAQECDSFAQMVVETPAPPQTPSSFKTGLEKHKSAPKNPDVLLIGDSLAANWQGDDLKRDLRNRNVWNLGVSGYTIQNTLWTLSQIEPAKVSPQVIIIVIGTNNFSASAMPVCSLATGIEKVVNTAAGYWPKAKIFLLSIPPRGPDFQLRADDRIELNETLATFARTNKQLAFVTFDEGRLTCGFLSKPKLDATAVACQPDLKYQCQFFKEDNLHLNSNGYKLVREAITQTSQKTFGIDVLQ